MATQCFTDTIKAEVSPWRKLPLSQNKHTHSGGSEISVTNVMFLNFVSQWFLISEPFQHTARWQNVYSVLPFLAVVYYLHVTLGNFWLWRRLVVKKEFHAAKSNCTSHWLHACVMFTVQKWSRASHRNLLNIFSSNLPHLTKLFMESKNTVPVHMQQSCLSNTNMANSIKKKRQTEMLKVQKSIWILFCEFTF